MSGAKVRALQQVSDHVLGIVQADLDSLTGVTRLAAHLDRLTKDEAYRAGAIGERDMIHHQWVELVAGTSGRNWRQRVIHDFSKQLEEGK